jgi:uncharacterized membrane protein
VATSARSLSIAAAVFLASLAVYPRIPTPYCGFDCNTPLGRPLVAFMLPIAAAFTVILLDVLWKCDPIRDRDAETEATYAAIIFRVVLFVLGVHAAMLVGLVSELQTDVVIVVARTLPLMFGLALVSIGNLLPRLRPNGVIGIRTPRTLADRSTWARTHRAAGYTTVAMGISILASTLLPGVAVRAVTIVAAEAAAITLVWCLWQSRHA